jgi:hypothetical protein
MDIRFSQRHGNRGLERDITIREDAPDSFALRGNRIAIDAGWQRCRRPRGPRPRPQLHAARRAPALRRQHRSIPDAALFEDMAMPVTLVSVFRYVFFSLAKEPIRCRIRGFKPLNGPDPNDRRIAEVLRVELVLGERVGKIAAPLIN